MEGGRVPCRSLELFHFLFCFKNIAFRTFSFSSFLPSLARFTKCDDTGESMASVGDLNFAFNLFSTMAFAFKLGKTGVDEEGLRYLD